MTPTHRFKARFGSLVSPEQTPGEVLTRKMQTQWLSNEVLRAEFDKLPLNTLLGTPPKGFETLQQVKDTFYYGLTTMKDLNTQSTNKLAKVSWQGHDYCLKKFGIGGNASWNALNEFRTLSFLSAQGAKDVLKPVMASIKGSGNWILSEWIPDRPLSQKEWDKRGQTTVGQLCEQHQISPHLSPDDCYQGIVVDTEYTGQDQFLRGEGLDWYDTFMETYQAAPKKA